MINDILDMSRIEAGRTSLTKQPIAVNASIQRALRLVSEQIKAKNLTITVDVIPEDIVVPADERAIHQILVNLLQNATKFTSDGGCITVRTRQAGDAINIYVEDNGIGIPEHALHKLGRPFEQVETEFSKSYKGSGLGLAIARSLTELHGGALAHQKPGRRRNDRPRPPAADGSEQLGHRAGRYGGVSSKTPAQPCAGVVEFSIHHPGRRFRDGRQFALQDEVVRRQREASRQQCELHRDTAAETIRVIGQVARAAVVDDLRPAAIGHRTDRQRNRRNQTRRRRRDRAGSCLPQR